MQKNLFIVTMGFMFMATGAFTQNIWQRTNGPVVEGALQRLSINSSGHIFAGVTNGGVFRSTNKGETWTNQNNGLPNLEVLGIGFNSLGHVFAATAGGIYRSIDNGDSWVAVSSDLIFGAYAMLVNFHPDSSLEVMYVASAVYEGQQISGTRIFVSYDKGTSWVKAADIEVPNISIYCMAVDTNNNIYVGFWNDEGIFRSTNNGITWLRTSMGLPAYTGITSFIGSRDNYLYAGTSGAGGGANGNGVVYVSSTGGSSWFLRSAGLPTGKLVWALAVHPATHYVYAGLIDGGVFRSTNHGLDWRPFSTGLTDDTVMSLAFSPDGELYAGTYHDGVFRCTQPTSAVDDDNASMKETIILSQNYPNPFSTKTTFAVNGTGLFEVRDMLGRVVYQTKADDGQTHLTFDGSNLPNGLYEYSLSNGVNVQSRLMMVIH